MGSGDERLDRRSINDVAGPVIHDTIALIRKRYESAVLPMKEAH